MSLTHKAIVYEKANTPGKLQSRPNPLPEKGQVVIEITATAVNPVDYKGRDGMFPLPFPVILGSDAAGIVYSVGQGVTDFKKGDRVFFQGILGNNDACTFQQKLVLDEKLISHTPDNISDDEAAGVQLAGMAAAVGLYHESGAVTLRPLPWDEGGDKAGEGKAIVVLGGSSSVGQYVIQLARLSGFSKIITTSSAQHKEWLESLGAHTIVPREAATGDFIAAADGLPIVAVFDSIATDETQRVGVQLLQEANKETTATTGASHYVNVRPGIEHTNFTNPDVTVRAIIGKGSNPDLAEVALPFIKAISGNEGWIGKGLFKPNRVQKISGGLNSLDKALDTLRAGVSGVKIVIDPRETQ
ncbi:unnamed protein product [Parajaminaea phylloscopi]